MRLGIAAGTVLSLALLVSYPHASVHLFEPCGKDANCFSDADLYISQLRIVLGFNVGNEVITATTDIQAAPYVKAALRDVKSYISTHGFTQLVGYTATDTPNSRIAFPYYLACDDSLGGSGYFDYWGLNIYEWCGESDFVTSGYQARTAELAALGIVSTCS